MQVDKPGATWGRVLEEVGTAKIAAEIGRHQDSWPGFQQRINQGGGVETVNQYGQVRRHQVTSPNQYFQLLRRQNTMLDQNVLAFLATVLQVNFHLILEERPWPGYNIVGRVGPVNSAGQQAAINLPPVVLFHRPQLPPARRYLPLDHDQHVLDPSWINSQAMPPAVLFRWVENESGLRTAVTALSAEQQAMQNAGPRPVTGVPNRQEGPQSAPASVPTSSAATSPSLPAPSNTPSVPPSATNSPPQPEPQPQQTPQPPPVPLSAFERRIRTLEDKTRELEEDRTVGPMFYRRRRYYQLTSATTPFPSQAVATGDYTASIWCRRWGLVPPRPRMFRMFEEALAQLGRRVPESEDPVLLAIAPSFRNKHAREWTDGQIASTLRDIAVNEARTLFAADLDRWMRTARNLTTTGGLATRDVARTRLGVDGADNFLRVLAQDMTYFDINALLFLAHAVRTNFIVIWEEYPKVGLSRLVRISPLCALDEQAAIEAYNRPPVVFFGHPVDRTVVRAFNHKLDNLDPN